MSFCRVVSSFIVFGCVCVRFSVTFAMSLSALHILVASSRWVMTVWLRGLLVRWMVHSWSLIGRTSLGVTQTIPVVFPLPNIGSALALLALLDLLLPWAVVSASWSLHESWLSTEWWVWVMWLLLTLDMIGDAWW